MEHQSVGVTSTDAYVLPQRDEALLQLSGKLQVIDDFLVLGESVL